VHALRHYSATELIAAADADVRTVAATTGTAAVEHTKGARPNGRAPFRGNEPVLTPMYA
jgi:integrase